MNVNRVVNLAKTAGGRDWRDWLSVSRLAGIVGLNNLRISDEVKLVLSDETYQYSIVNKADPVLSNFIEQIGSKGVTGAVLRIGEAIDTALEGTAAATFNPWFKNIKAWRNTEPVALPLRFDFKMGQFGLWDAKQEVVLPILALLLPSLPKTVDTMIMDGPFQSATSLLTLILKGTAINLMGGGKDIASSISSAILGEVNRSTYTVSIGKQLLLDKAYCVDAAVTLSTTTDQNGLPTSGSIQLKFEGALPPAISNSVAQSIRFFQ